jgi:hypothetical protein
MYETNSFETPVTVYQSTRRRISEDLRENLKIS